MMQRFQYYALSLILLFFFLTCCANNDIEFPKFPDDTDDIDYIYEPSPTADINIVNWEQDYWDYSGKWDQVKINYEITNTGVIIIDYYTIWFEVKCVDGSKYVEDDISGDILPGTTKADYTYVYTADKEAVAVRLFDYELEHYDW